MNLAKAIGIINARIEPTKQDFYSENNFFITAVNIVFPQLQEELRRRVREGEDQQFNYEESHQYTEFIVKYAIDNNMSEYIVEQLKLHLGWYIIQESKKKKLVK
ncbi:MAG TPA: hypothetical protein PKY25_00240 [Bacilli bacterium]|nr:hypothetical protein [Bacilli bacterium]